jgi:serine protease Do
MSFPIDLKDCIPWGKPATRTSSNFEGLYLIQDPFKLRENILPILAKTKDSPETWEGLGTAFKIDCFGSLMSAQHNFHNLNDDTLCFVMESQGLCYGEVPLMNELFSPIIYREYLSYDKDDPLAKLAGNTQKEIFYDVASIISQPQNSINSSPALKVSFKNSSILKDDEVMAIGYPQIGKLSDINKVYKEKLMCSVGKILEIHKTGRHGGENWPSFVINANLPSGMSGGPVFNKSGFVIGVVSTSLENQDGTFTPGTAVALPYCSEEFIAKSFPNLELLRPGWINGWGVLRKDPWEFIKIFRDEETAEIFKKEKKLDFNYVVNFGSNEMGTDNFISSID